MSKPSVAIQYGFLGGKAHSRQMRKQLDSAGFTVVDNAANADIVLAHSAGCWQLPELTKTKLLLLVGTPLRPNQPLRMFLKSNRANIRSFVQTGSLLKGSIISFKSTANALRHPIHNAKTIKQSYSWPTIPQSYPVDSIIFIANHYDPWPRRDALDQPFAYLSLPGTHDHIWEDATDYVTIISIYAQRLLAAPNKR